MQHVQRRTLWFYVTVEIASSCPHVSCTAVETASSARTIRNILSGCRSESAIVYHIMHVDSAANSGIGDRRRAQPAGWYAAPPFTITNNCLFTHWRRSSTHGVLSVKLQTCPTVLTSRLTDIYVNIHVYERVDIARVSTFIDEIMHLSHYTRLGCVLGANARQR